MDNQGLKLRSDAPSPLSELEEFDDSATYDPVTSLGADVPTSRLGAPTYAVAQQLTRQKVESNATTSAWIQGTTSFVLFSLGLIALQVWGRFNPGHAAWYTVVSFVFCSLIGGIVIIKAFFDSLSQGVILISIPALISVSFMALAKKATAVTLGAWIFFSLAWFYYPYYVFFKMERSPIIKGVFGALLLASITEFPIMGDATILGRAIGDMIEVAGQLAAQGK
jgi:hypothetical protein